MVMVSSKIKKEVSQIAREFGFSSEEEFVSEAIKEKILELKKMKFFAISEKIRKGLLKKGIEPKTLLKTFKS